MKQGNFDFLNVPFFTKAETYPGSVGAFRYRFRRSSWYDRPDGQIQAWVYENICFEQARNIETAVFPWTEDGVQTLKTWLEERLEERGAEPYRVPYPPEGGAHGAEDAEDAEKPCGEIS